MRWVFYVQVLRFYLRVSFTLRFTTTISSTAAKHSCVSLQLGKSGNIGLTAKISLVPSAIINHSHPTHQ